MSKSSPSQEYPATADAALGADRDGPADSRESNRIASHRITSTSHSTVTAPVTSPVTAPGWACRRESGRRGDGGTGRRAHRRIANNQSSTDQNRHSHSASHSKVTVPDSHSTSHSTCNPQSSTDQNRHSLERKYHMACGGVVHGAAKSARNGPRSLKINSRSCRTAADAAGRRSERPRR